MTGIPSIADANLIRCVSAIVPVGRPNKSFSEGNTDAYSKFKHIWTAMGYHSAFYLLFCSRNHSVVSAHVYFTSLAPLALAFHHLTWSFFEIVLPGDKTK